MKNDYCKETGKVSKLGHCKKFPCEIVACNWPNGHQFRRSEDNNLVSELSLQEGETHH